MEYKLPPLPTFEEWCRIISPSEPGTQIASVENFVKAYAIAAIEAQASEVQQEPCGRLEADEFDGHVFVPRIAGDWSMLNKDLYTHPAQQAKPQPLSDEQIEKGRQATFSTNNPFCPCDSKTMRKAVRWAEAAHGIQGS